MEKLFIKINVCPSRENITTQDKDFVQLGPSFPSAGNLLYGPIYRVLSFYFLQNGFDERAAFIMYPVIMYLVIMYPVIIYPLIYVSCQDLVVCRYGLMFHGFLKYIPRVQ